MKLKVYLHIILATALLFASAVQSSAQVTSQKQNFDTDIWTLRNSIMPGFQYSYDEYLQYAPAGVMVAMKACGYEGRSSWGRMVVSDAFSVALMAGTVKGLKHTVHRLRPDGSDSDSFPSGHTATAFMTATMLHKEYGWRSPWFSIGGYTAAAVTGASRIMNNRHWMSDVVAGAAIGIGAVHLGYFLTDLIFKDKGLFDGFRNPEFLYDPNRKHYVAELAFGQRFIIGNQATYLGSPYSRGGMAALSTDIPILPGVGLTGTVSVSSLAANASSKGSESIALYAALAGGFYNFHFARILELQVKAMAGYAHIENHAVQASSSGIDLCAGMGLSLITGNNFKIKAFANLETISQPRNHPWLNTLTVGFSSGWFW